MIKHGEIGRQRSPFNSLYREIVDLKCLAVATTLLYLTHTSIEVIRVHIMLVPHYEVHISENQ